MDELGNELKTPNLEPQLKQEDFDVLIQWFEYSFIPFVHRLCVLNVFVYFKPLSDV